MINHIVESFLSASKYPSTFEEEENQSSSGESDSVRVDMNSANMSMTNIPWFLTPAAH